MKRAEPLLLGGLFAAAFWALAGAPPTTEPENVQDASVTLQDASMQDASLQAPRADERSPVIYPAQTIALHFDHDKHLAIAGDCVTCHAQAKTSRRVSDSLIPTGRACDSCHSVDHGDLNSVHFTQEKPTNTPIPAGGSGRTSTCATCHVGWVSSDGGKVAASRFPTPHLGASDHAVHAARNIGCAQCHGSMKGVGLATRDQLPTMETCLRCHQNGSEAAFSQKVQGLPKGTCTTCHEARTESNGAVAKEGQRLGGRMRVVFPEGTLLPPMTMNGAGHDVDFLARHKFVAGLDSSLCANCHTDASCTDCHDGRVRPRNIHPNDYLSLHATESRLKTTTCTSCHQETNFCLPCHQRLGIASSSPLNRKDASRFHPPKETFSDLPRKPGHHAQEAARNLDSCVSCHTERDCVACHGAGGRGGGFDPHPGGFVARCATLYARNPRPCLVCHEPDSRDLSTCR